MNKLSMDARRYAEGLKRDVADWNGDDDLRLGAAETLLKQDIEIAELREAKDGIVALMRVLVTMPPQRAMTTMKDALRQVDEQRAKQMLEAK